MMTMDDVYLDRLERRIRILLPELYQDSYEEIQPVSMGSAALKYDNDGKVQWNEMWATFCDLAMAGGPPHKGALLDAGDPAAIQAQPERHAAVVGEICRGIHLVTKLPVAESPNPGWVRVTCDDETMAQWLLRAVVMENVSARCEGASLDLPASPAFRHEKEIKNVITVTAKTCHYWMDHIWDAHQALIGELLAEIEKESPLIGPSVPAGQAGWRGVDCGDVSKAIWKMRALVAFNVLSRREATTLFVPVNEQTDPRGQRVDTVLARVHRLARLKGVL